MLGKLLHTCLVAEDGALRTLARGVDGEDGQTTSFLFQHMDAELVDRGTLARSWHTADAHTNGMATIGQTFIDNLLSSGLMVGIHTFDEGDGL